MIPSKLGTLAAVLLFPAATQAGIEACTPCIGGEGSCSIGSWDSDAWSEMWEKIWEMCNNHVTVSSQGPVYFDLYGKYVHVQQTLHPGMSNEHCATAFEQIVGGCMDSYQNNVKAGGDGSLGTTSQSGYWYTDPSQKEWYWIWLNEDAWCPNISNGQGCVRPA